jgi:hypothetical protein
LILQGPGILEDADLKDMGVSDERERRRILDDAARLPSKLPHHTPGSAATTTSVVNQFDSVKEWLEYLNLEFYHSKFVRYKFGEMDKVRKMWEVELTTILEITLPGHKKRILASIGPGCNEDGRSSLSSSTSSLAASGHFRGSDVTTDIMKLVSNLFERQHDYMIIPFFSFLFCNGVAVLTISAPKEYSVAQMNFIVLWQTLWDDGVMII